MDPLSMMLQQISFGLADGILLLSLAVLLGLSAFFSSSETAFSTANIIRIRNYSDDKKKGARKALWIMENYDKTLTTILVGNNFVNIASTTICAIVFGKLILDPTLANVLNTVIMTIIVLIFGEILPKSMAKANPEKYALRYSGIMFILVKILVPITYPFNVLQRALLKRTKSNDNPTVTEDELESIIDTMEEEGVLNAHDADLFQNVIDLDNQDVYEIMTPRIDMVAININAKVAELAKTFATSGFSRVPVYNDDKDHIVGIVHYKDYFKNSLLDKKFTIKEIMVEPLFVAENMKINDLMRKMQSDKKHMAVVIDEHGGTSGIVTLEDAIEEMLGEIYDEHDEEEDVVSYIKKLEEGIYMLNSDINLDDLFETLEIENLPETEYSTLGGYLYELSENLPELGQEFDVVTIDEQMGPHGEDIIKTVKLKFIITKIEDKSIEEVKLIVEPVEITDSKGNKKLKSKVD